MTITLHNQPGDAETGNESCCENVGGLVLLTPPVRGLTGKMIECSHNNRHAWADREVDRVLCKYQTKGKASLESNKTKIQF
jgi:hypothetical protein